MASAKIVLNTGEKLKGDNFAVILQIIHARKKYRIRLGYKCTMNQWDKDNHCFRKSFPNASLKNTVLRKKLAETDKVFEEIKLEGKQFSIKLFRQMYLNDSSIKTVFDFIDEVVADFHKKNKIGTGDTYHSLGTRLLTFNQSRELRFSDIDYNFLTKLESWLLANGRQSGGVNHFMRHLRGIFNMAIAKGLVSFKIYPFSNNLNKSGYSISKLKSNAKPRALHQADMEKLKRFDFEKYQDLKISYLFFMFSYYTMGINFKDMALLKKENIYYGRIKYKRAKTGGDFDVKISVEMQKIIDFFDNGDSYVFPILNDFHQTERQISDRIKKKRKHLNKELGKIAQIIGINIKLTTYVARHTFADTLYKKGVHIAKISKALGHANITTTEVYLKKISNTELDDLDTHL